MSNGQPKPFAQMSRSELISEVKRLRKDSESEMTLQMLISAGFVTEAKVAHARKIARDLISKQHSE